jgi:hypothetical protein
MKNYSILRPRSSPLNRISFSFLPQLIPQIEIQHLGVSLHHHVLLHGVLIIITTTGTLLCHPVAHSHPKVLVPPAHTWDFVKFAGSKDILLKDVPPFG